MRSLLIISFILIPIFVYGQDSDSISSWLSSQTVVASKPMHVGISAGSSFWTAGRGSSGFSNWIAPSLFYSVNPKLHFHGGILLVRNGFTVPAMSESSPVTGHGINQTMIYAGGEYILGRNISVSGTVIKDVTPEVWNTTDPRIRYSNFNRVSMRVNYHITDNIHIGAEVGVTNGYHPFFSEPYRIGQRSVSPYMNPYFW